MKKKLAIVGIFLVAAFFRLQNVNWDAGYHLHPDERFLTMVGNDMKLPSTFLQYLEPSVSSFNPVNTGHNFYVYGVLPIIISKLLALLLGTDTYGLFTLQGRVLSALCDLVTLFFVYRVASMTMQKRTAGYVAALIYALSVLPIQLSHFFTTDSFLSMFMFGSFYFALLYKNRGKYGYGLISAAFLACAAATKINAILIAPLVGFIIFKKTVVDNRSIRQAFEMFVGFLIVLYFVLRIADPYYFETGDVFDLTPSRVFINNILQLKSFEGKDIWYPPGIQWINTKPVLFSLVNMAFFGLGLPICAAVVFGLFRFIRTFFKKKKSKDDMGTLMVLFIFIMGIFFYQSTQFVKVMRYFIFIYPMLAIFGGYGVSGLFDRVKNRAFRTGIIAIFFMWPVVFSTIYLSTNTRVEASQWLYEHAGNHSVILTEYWDDPLPLMIPEQYGKQFVGQDVKIFDQDTKEKWDIIGKQLTNADYYVMSSNRAWGSIPTVPEKYPVTARFYRDFMSEGKGYHLVKAFYPSYFQYTGMDIISRKLLSDWLDESFTVYDHPTVLIYQNDKK